MLFYIKKKSSVLNFTITFLYSMVLFAKCGETNARMSVYFWLEFVVVVYLKYQVHLKYQVLQSFFLVVLSRENESCN